MTGLSKASRKRHADHPIDPIFLERWSPRAMTGEEISEAELNILFEAARWAPSSYNNQPWRILYARRNTKHWQTFFDLMGEFNQSWTHKAAALLVIISKKTFEHNGKPSITHSYDTGAAWISLALQGAKKGYVVHGMQGFDYDRARQSLKIPDDYQVEAMAAIGKPGDPAELPPNLLERESPSDRKKLDQIVREGEFSF